jgi:hypothetical protein
VTHQLVSKQFTSAAPDLGLLVRFYQSLGTDEKVHMLLPYLALLFEQVQLKNI